MTGIILEGQVVLEGHEIDAMVSGLTDVILNLETFVKENKGHSTDSSLRDAMNLCASMLGAICAARECGELRSERDEKEKKM